MVLAVFFCACLRMVAYARGQVTVRFFLAVRALDLLFVFFFVGGGVLSFFFFVFAFDLALFLDTFGRGGGTFVGSLSSLATLAAIPVFCEEVWGRRVRVCGRGGGGWASLGTRVLGWIVPSTKTKRVLLARVG